MTPDEMEPTAAELFDEPVEVEEESVQHDGRLTPHARQCLAEARAALVRPDDGRRR